MIKKKLTKFHKWALKHKLIISCLLFFATGFVLGAFILGVKWIGYDVRQQCVDAREEYQGTCVEALSKLILDPRQKLRHRIQAVWALGQLGDKNALPALEELATLPECQKGSECEYELGKALRLARGGINITAPFWRLQPLN